MEEEAHGVQQDRRELWVPTFRWFGPWWLSAIVLLTFVVRFAMGDFDGWQRPFGVACIVLLTAVIAADLWRRRQRKRTGQS